MGSHFRDRLRGSSPTLLTIAMSSALTLFGVGAIFVTYLLAAIINTPLDPMGRSLLYTASGLAVCVAGGFLSTLFMLVYVGVREHGAGLMRTPFYLPQLIKHASLFAVTAPGALRGVDRIFHHGHLTWTYLSDPEVIVLGLAWYFVILVSSLWFNATWVITSNFDRAASRRRVARAIVGFEVFIVACCILLYWLGS